MAVVLAADETQEFSLMILIKHVPFIKVVVALL